MNKNITQLRAGLNDWADKWSRSQVVVLVLVNLAWIGVAWYQQGVMERNHQRAEEYCQVLREKRAIERKEFMFKHPAFMMWAKTNQAIFTNH